MLFFYYKILVFIIILIAAGSSSSSSNCYNNCYRILVNTLLYHTRIISEGLKNERQLRTTITLETMRQYTLLSSVPMTSGLLLLPTTTTSNNNSHNSSSNIEECINFIVEIHGLCCKLTNKLLQHPPQTTTFSVFRQSEMINRLLLVKIHTFDILLLLQQCAATSNIAPTLSNSSKVVYIDNLPMFTTDSPLTTIKHSTTTTLLSANNNSSTSSVDHLLNELPWLSPTIYKLILPNLVRLLNSSNSSSSIRSSNNNQLVVVLEYCIQLFQESKELLNRTENNNSQWNLFLGVKYCFDWISQLYRFISYFYYSHTTATEKENIARLHTEVSWNIFIV